MYTKRKIYGMSRLHQWKRAQNESTNIDYVISGIVQDPFLLCQGFEWWLVSSVFMRQYMVDCSEAFSTFNTMVQYSSCSCTVIKVFASCSTTALYKWQKTHYGYSKEFYISSDGLILSMISWNRDSLVLSLTGIGVGLPHSGNLLSGPNLQAESLTKLSV